MMASKTWKIVQPHIPMIRFRKGDISAAIGATAPSSKTGSVQTAGAVRGPGVTILPTIEDIYLPQRFQRKPIDQKEIDYINRGGPE